MMLILLFIFFFFLRINYFFLYLIFFFFLFFKPNYIFYNIFILDYLSYSMFFLLFFVGTIILNYSNMYFFNEISKYKFFIFIFLFLFFMIFLSISYNLFILVLSWEGVGIMSFLLINWWYGRYNASSSALTALYYNRIGDFFFFFFIGIMGHWCNWDYSNFFILGWLVFVIFSKSSLFLFHPWLPMAMEGPTPVSALLHSSTMVVAGVFLFIRISFFFSLNFLMMIMLISSITYLWGGFNSSNQNDLKKIIAYSTTSQLGLMTMTCSIINSYLSFFLLLCHGFFKSLLFMCSGIFIHSSNNQQNKNYQYMSMIVNPLTSLIFIISLMSLCSISFFTGFFSKHLMLENMMGNVMNCFFFISFLMGSMFTVTYSLMMFFLYFNMMKSFIILFQEDKMNSFFFSSFFLIFFIVYGGYMFMYLDINFYYMENMFFTLFDFYLFYLIIFFGLYYLFFLKLMNKMKMVNGFFYNFFLHNYMNFYNFVFFNFMIFFEFFMLEFLLNFVNYKNLFYLFNFKNFFFFFFFIYFYYIFFYNFLLMCLYFKMMNCFYMNKIKYFFFYFEYWF
uniref:NADH:ubiquinone reductase (H(+)-translocating) n=1 Tax=Lissoclinum sp. TIC-2013-079 TaxID=2010181 RepID=A0A2D1CBU0_9ASCI|nr:NADH dehydrogenase subunit 5 [Lissoclinum sp. TIC-2013-079]